MKENIPFVHRKNLKIGTIVLFLLSFLIVHQEVIAGWKLKDIHFLNSNIGWAVGRDGTILKTNDGGNNWAYQNSGINAQLMSVHFSDINYGWAVGGGGIILSTGDGGVNWVQQSSGSTEFLSSVFFIDSNIGWTVGGLWGISTILKTTNGGSNWIPQTSGTNEWLQSVFFVDVNTGWTVGSGGIILNTTNGGNNWNPQSSGTNNELYSVYFVDANIGLAVGDAGTILKTTNGGSTWSIKNSGTSIGLKSVYFINNNIGWAVGHDMGANGEGTILKTNDGGNTWTTQIIDQNWFTSVYFTGPNIGWTACVGGSISFTDNGGASWVHWCQFVGHLILDGLNDYAETGDHSELDIGGNSITIEARLYFDVYDSVLIVHKPNAYSLYTIPEYSSGGHIWRGIGFLIWSGSSAVGYRVSFSEISNSFDFSGWQHIAGIFDQATKRIFLFKNGERYNPWYFPNLVPDNSNDPLSIGKYLNGKLDEIRISDTLRYSLTAQYYETPVAPFQDDQHTRALWHFEDGKGATEFHDVAVYDNILFGYNGAHTIGNPVSIDQVYSNTSNSYHLYQNYPNPFNTTTTIEFVLPKTSEVSLKIYNLLGEEVATLVSEKLTVGSYQYNWDASTLASGVYIYRLEVGEYIEKRKMILLK